MDAARDEPGPVVFAHIEKTAGKTTRELLRRHFGTGHCELYNHPDRMRPSDLALIRRHHPRLRSLAGHACMPSSVVGQIPGARIFTFLRDPVDRASRPSSTGTSAAATCRRSRSGRSGTRISCAGC